MARVNHLLPTCPTALATSSCLLGHEHLDTVRIYSQPDEAAPERAATALESGYLPR